MDHVSNFLTEDGGYGATFRLLDGTLANVVTVFTGSGLSADTEIHSEREITDLEAGELLNLDVCFDHADGDPQVSPYFLEFVRHY